MGKEWEEALNKAMTQVKKEADKALNMEVRKFTDKLKDMEDHIKTLEEKNKGLENRVLELTEENGFWRTEHAAIQRNLEDELAVPMKTPAVLDAKMDPIIYQSYKSFTCFATCWLVLIYTPLKFTWWGMLGALIWVINGCAAVRAVQLVGIGLAQSLWSSLSKKRPFLQISALCNMGSKAWAADLAKMEDKLIGNVKENKKIVDTSMNAILIRLSKMEKDMETWQKEKEEWEKDRTKWEEEKIAMQAQMETMKVVVSYIWGAYIFKEAIQNHALSLLSVFIMLMGMLGVGFAIGNQSEKNLAKQCTAVEVEPLNDLGSCLLIKEPKKPVNIDGKDASQVHRLILLKGIGLATIVGILNGSFLIPLKYAHQDVVGVEYLVSFGVGSLVMTVTVLGTYWFSCKLSGNAFPSFKIKEGAKPALLTGLLWSMGNFLR
ncbi:hypothetical protein L7F22_066375 [Adiantum nelumboides]|nr:hypothetical protein [Adiantum nelumboides]